MEKISISEGNKLLRSGRFSEALVKYLLLRLSSDALKGLVRFNADFAAKKLVSEECKLIFLCSKSDTGASSDLYRIGSLLGKEVEILSLDGFGIDLRSDVNSGSLVRVIEAIAANPARYVVFREVDECAKDIGLLYKVIYRSQLLGIVSNEEGESFDSLAQKCSYARALIGEVSAKVSYQSISGRVRTVDLVAGLVESLPYRALRQSELSRLSCRFPGVEPLVEHESRLYSCSPCPQGFDLHIYNLIINSGLFDQLWYYEKYFKDVAYAENLLEHYLNDGYRKGFDPSVGFSTRYYLRSNPDVAAANMNPFVHYVAQGINEGRRPLPQDLKAVSLLQNVCDEQYVPYRESIWPLDTPTRLVAFYLPQFHEIPENNEWWGQGFTEWTNVKPAKPSFPGHYQPHEPDVLGYYDLTDVEVLRKQVQLAENYGVGAFCFYFYWFGGKRLLYKPVDLYLQNKDLSLPFCLCWANENWTRRWDGRDQDLLIGQEHSPEDDIAFITAVAEFMKDERYIRIDGKPLLIIYRPSLFPDIRSTAKRWREWCKKNGVGDIHLALTHSFERTAPEDIGFDSAIEFSPNNSGPPNITAEVPGVPDSFKGNIYDWNALVERSENLEPQPYLYYRGICPSWDNTARKKENASILLGSCPREYQRWLLNLLQERPDSPKLIFVNAWNEWAEGAHLEPDKKYGFGYLEATRSALRRFRHANGLEELSDPRIAVVIHSFYPDVLKEIISSLNELSELAIKVWVTCPPEKVDQNHFELNSLVHEWEIRVFENKGRDILPFLGVVKEIALEGIPVILKLHTKKSKHREDGDSWRKDLFSKLMNSRSVREANRLIRHGGVGIVGPESHLVPMDSYWGSNQEKVLRLASRLGVSNEEVFDMEFVAGSMMFLKTLPLVALVELLSSDEFESEAGQTDGTLAHAVERILPILMHSFRLSTIDTTFSLKGNRLLETYQFADVG